MTARREPIAIVGAGCRLPGARDVGAYWRLLVSGQDAITEIPKDRFDLDVFFDPRPATPGKLSCRHGGFLPEIDGFDAAYFGVSPREAERLDPQQRLLLEVAHEALEDAGQPLAGLAGTSAGVFVGMWLNDYEGRLLSDPSGPDFYMTTGSGRYAASGRLSYVLGLQGPSLTVDTACSSSLAAMHLACQSLWAAECPLAIVGAANVILSPYISIAYSQSRMLAADGRCKFGDARADGYVRSEGAAALVLKPLADALRDGDRVRALVLGTSLNNDGVTSGSMTTPGRGGQEDMLRKAYLAAGVPPARVVYVEAHGTGTRAGDPVELAALGVVLGEGRPRDRPCAVGSAKTNIGHTEGAAGLAGLIKTVLCLEQRTIVPSLHFREPNPAVPWAELPLYIPTETRPFPDGERSAIAGVSAFGISGTNSHVVLQEAPRARDSAPAEEPRTHLLPLSAKSEAALADLARAHRDWLSGDGATLPLADVCHTAGERRSHHEHRLAVAGRLPQDLAAGLDAFLAGEARPCLVSGRRPAEGSGRVVFVFPGQGSQWLGMGRQLAEWVPAFRASLEACDQAVRAAAGWSILDEIHATPERSRLDDISVIQPTLFAVQVALAALWRSWGVAPAAIVGHSMGEVAAAHVAGVLSLADAARVICRRSELMRRVAGRGAMALVELSLDEARRAIQAYHGRLSVAVSNSSRSTVVSGDKAAIEELLPELERREVFARRVKVDVASHSPHMDPLMSELDAALEGLQASPAAVPLRSTVTGAAVDGREMDRDYWVRNLREPVLFSSVVRGLAEAGHDLFLEVSPHPVLVASIQQELDVLGGGALALGSLLRDEDESISILTALGGLYSRGLEIDWRLPQQRPGRVVSLPCYPWQRERYWLGASPTTASVDALGAGGGDPLLGMKLSLAAQPDTDVWECRPGPGWPGRAFAHEIDGTSWLGASGIVDLAAAALQARFGAGGLVLEDVELREPILLDETPRAVQVVVDGPADGAAFRLFSRADETWTLHVTGRARLSADAAPAAPAAASPPAGAGLDNERFYARLDEKARLRFSESARGVVELQVGSEGAQATCRQVGPALPGLGRSGLAAGVLDAVFQVVAAARLATDTGGLRMPRRIGRIHLQRRPGGPPLSEALVRVFWEQSDGDAPVGCVVEPADGGPGGVRFEAIETFALDGDRAAATDVARAVYALEWRPRSEPAPPSRTPASWLILGDPGGLGEALAERLSASGERVALATAGTTMRQVDESRFEVSPSSRDELRDLVARLAEAEAPALTVVQLWDLDADGSAESAVQACTHLVATLQALGGLTAARLVAVTRGAQAAGESTTPIALAQAALWGLGRVAAEEHPDLWGGLFDLDPARTPAAGAEFLARELRLSQGGSERAFRGEGVLVPRLTSRPPQETTGPALRRDASYLVTGGLGALGLAVARWLAERGARRLVLLGRRGLPPRSDWSADEPLDETTRRRVEAVRELERLGVAVHVTAADVGDEASLTAFLQGYRREGWPPIRGVVHCAGAIQDALVADLDADALAVPFHGKARGAELLDRSFADGELDFLVFFSSIGALWGQPGQGAYAAANAYLDALAQARRRAGRVALSVNWPVWSALGFADTEGGRRVAEALLRRGIHGLRAETALDLLGRLLGSEDAQIAILPADWARVRKESPRLPEVVVDLAAAPASEAKATTGTSLPETLAGLPVGERRERLEGHLQQQLATVLKLRPDRIERSRPVRSLGLDSLMALELRKRLEASLGLPLSATLVWNHPTVAAIATHMAARLGLELDGASVPGPEPPGPPTQGVDLSEVAKLSDEEALRALMGGDTAR